jgi:hypothetical protein
MVFALSAMLAVTASAEVTLLAEWLKNGTPVTTELAKETSGEILLEDNKTSFGAAALLCSWIFDGTVGPNGEDLITKVLSLTGIELGELVGAGLSCSGETLCSSGEVWVLGLPWDTLLILMEDGSFLDLILGAIFHLLCVAVFSFEDECTAVETGFKVENGVGDVLSSTTEAASPNANCTLGGAGSAVFQSEGSLTSLINGETLQISSE